MHQKVVPAKAKETRNICYLLLCSNLEMALEMIESETLYTHDSHDGLRCGLCEEKQIRQQKNKDNSLKTETQEDTK